METDKILKYKDFIKNIVKLMDKVDELDSKEEHSPQDFKPYNYHEVKCLREFVDADIEKYFDVLEPKKKFFKRQAFLFLNYRTIYLPELLYWGMADTLEKF